MQFKNKNFLVYGVLKSGIAACNLIEKMGGNVFFYDDQMPEMTKSMLENRGYIFTHKSQLFGILQDIYCLVISPGICLESPLVSMANSMGIYITNEIELSHSLFNAPIVAVTGTNGKSTTVSLIHHTLQSSGMASHLLGNFGIPLSQKALEIHASDTVVLEVSSYQLELAKTLTPHIAIFTNFAPDHLVRHKSIDNYFAVKASMFLRQKESEFAILNADDIRVCELGKVLNSNTYYFSLEREVRGAYTVDDCIYFQDGENPQYVMPVSDVKLLGRHNIENVLCAVIACKLLGISFSDIAIGVSTFLGLEHRLEYVREVDGKFFINDSKATNIASTLSAVRALKNSTTLLLGGSDKGEDFCFLFKNLPDNVTQVILFGDTRYRLLQAATDVCYHKIVVCQSMKEATIAALRYTLAGGNVLLSPSCPSFDYFMNFEDRGKKFKEAVMSL